jgi:hypothetical protein
MADASTSETIAEVVTAAIGIAIKLSPEVAKFLSDAKANGTLPDVLRPSVEKLDPTNVLDPYQKQLDELPDPAPVTQPSP